MGGLVARYYLEALDGWRNTRALITFGTPYSGAMKALDLVANGLRFDIPIMGNVEIAALPAYCAHLRRFTNCFPPTNAVSSVRKML